MFLRMYFTDMIPTKWRLTSKTYVRGLTQPYCYKQIQTCSDSKVDLHLAESYQQSLSSLQEKFDISYQLLQVIGGTLWRS